MVLICMLTGMLDAGPRPAEAQMQMEDLMDSVLEDVRQETRQSIQQQVKNETREVIAEDIVAPQIANASGSYQSVFAPAFIYILSMVQSGAGLSGSGADDVGGPYQFSGTVNGNLVNFSITGAHPCIAQVTGSGTLTGNQAGAHFSGSLNGIDCIGANISEQFDLVKN
jgi:hypothetical protein